MTTATITTYDFCLGGQFSTIIPKKSQMKFLVSNQLQSKQWRFYTTN